jgi:hypothetical protein
MPEFFEHISANFISEPHIKRDRTDNLPRNFHRRRPKRKDPYPKHTIHIKSLPREKAAIIMLYRKGFSINILNEFLGRSTSYIWKTIKKAISSGSLRKIEKIQGLSCSGRLRSSSSRRRMIAKYGEGWTAFILGEVDKPP